MLISQCEVIVIIIADSSVLKTVFKSLDVTTSVLHHFSVWNCRNLKILEKGYASGLDPKTKNWFFLP
jgi:hypothetical protein